MFSLVFAAIFSATRIVRRTASPPTARVCFAIRAMSSSEDNAVRLQAMQDACTAAGDDVRALKANKADKTEIDAALLGKLLAALAGRAAELRAGGATEGGRDWAAAEVRAGAEAEAGAGAAEEEASAAEAARLEEPLFLLSILRALPQTGRFSLNVNFLEDKDKASVATVVEWLGELGVEDAGALEATRALYFK